MRRIFQAPADLWTLILCPVARWHWFGGGDGRNVSSPAGGSATLGLLFHFGRQ